ncbi:MAG: triose-phosphate isomerase, partial [Chlamydiia bacterium]|nr:triose-phosphate isomerase [Chlamydiia bacterium]
MHPVDNQRPVLIVGNWKMHKTISETLNYLQTLDQHLSAHELQREVWLGVPFTALHSAKNACAQTAIKIGAQNLHEEAEGAYTGEISATMIKEAGADFVIIGHSERRRDFNESDEQIKQKLKQALAKCLTPILCIGETLEERENALTRDRLEMELKNALENFSFQAVHSLIIAYEPVWAIGTGRSATPEQAEEAHQIIRNCLASFWGSEAAEKIPLLYGGSVNVRSAPELLDAPNIDGLLIGGASLDP